MSEPVHRTSAVEAVMRLQRRLVLVGFLETHNVVSWFAIPLGILLSVALAYSVNNGSDWTEVTSSVPFGSRYEHSCVVHDGKIWVIGGYAAGYKNDVWWSANGSEWHPATKNAGFSPRYHNESLTYNNLLWVIGGNSGKQLKDVWFSSNGKDWTAAIKNAEFGTRDGHACTVFNNRMWVTDGSYLKDVWYSD